MKHGNYHRLKVLFKSSDLRYPISRNSTNAFLPLEFYVHTKNNKTKKI